MIFTTSAVAAALEVSLGDGMEHVSKATRRAIKQLELFQERMRDGRKCTAAGLGPFGPTTDIQSAGGDPIGCRKPRELVPEPPLGIDEARRYPLVPGVRRGVADGTATADENSSAMGNSFDGPGGAPSPRCEVPNTNAKAPLSTRTPTHRGAILCVPFHSEAVSVDTGQVVPGGTGHSAVEDGARAGTRKGDGVGGTGGKK